MISPCLTILGNAQLFFKVFAHFTHQYCVEVIISSYPLQYLLMLFGYIPFSGWEVITHQGTDLHAQDGY